MDNVTRLLERAFCCGKIQGKKCDNKPQYPNARGDRCKSFRCTRCKSTVGWCKGCDHGDLPNGKPHPANNWCDDCYVEVYLSVRALMPKG